MLECDGRRPRTAPRARCADRTSPIAPCCSATRPGIVHWDPGAARRRGQPVRRRGLHPAAVAQGASPDDEINSASATGSWPTWWPAGSTGARWRSPSRSCHTVHDAGTILNPALLDGQVHGAIVHALGGALLEELRYAGRPADRRHVHGLPVPDRGGAGFPLLSDHVETPSPVTRLGAKGCGEGSSMSIPGRARQRRGRRARPARPGSTSLPVHGTVLHELLAATPEDH